MQRILIIEDDTGIQEYIKDLLSENGYRIETSSDGISAFDMLKKNPVDLVILDLGLPKITGEALCRDIRKKFPHVPIVILTARDTTADVVKGLNLGADDYITKPFEADILLARVKARLRSQQEPILEADDLQLNTKTYEVKRAGKTITLSPHEFKLLQYFLNNKDQVLTREMILNRVWQYSYEVDSRVVDVYVGYLRKKIDVPFQKKLIQSVRGFGYVLKE
ncbi:MAG TPA: response regulator transcription factor [Patescibacteria group bacterium]|nr:response regulator transcription factor [Patescibacteria group bacterium]